MQTPPLPRDRRYKTSIPTNAKPRLTAPCAGSTGTRVEYFVRGKLVGTRHWDEGKLELEIPLRDGLRHGVEYTWFFGDWLSSAEPFFEGKPHGVAKQWSATGELLGTYQMVHGNPAWHRFGTYLPLVVERLGARVAGAGVAGDHDGEDVGERRARAMITLTAALPGSIYLYQGEELGLPAADTQAAALPWGQALAGLPGRLRAI